MADLLNHIPSEQLLYAAIGVFLPSIVGLAVFVKTQKDDILAKLNQTKIHVANAVDYVEDCVEGIIEGLGPDSPGGNALTPEEKAESWEMANKALAELKKAKSALLGE
jgi:hypothetical protein